MTLTRPCLICGTLTRAGSRCPVHQADLRRKYKGPWPMISRAAIIAYRTQHGDVCPGWRTGPHAIERSEWTTDHHVGPLCRRCNSSKQAVGDG